MKRRNKIIVSSIVWTFVLITVLVYFNRHEFFTALWRIKYPSPFEWNSMHVDLPPNFSYELINDNNFLKIFDFATVKDGLLSLQKMQIENSSVDEVINELQTDKGIVINDLREVDFRNYKGLLIETSNDNTNNYMKLIYIFPLNIRIGLIGNKRDNFKQFDIILERITFPDNNS